MKRVLASAPSAGLVLLMLSTPPVLTAAPSSPDTAPPEASTPGYVNLPDLGDVWSPEYLRDYYAYVVGPEIFDPATRDQFCEAIFFGGNTLRLWNEATDLKKSAAQLMALLKTAGRVIVAEDPVGGRELLAAIHMDTHMEAHTFRMMNGMGITERDLPIAGIPEMSRAFAGLTHTGSSVWLGLEPAVPTPSFLAVASISSRTSMNERGARIA